MSESVQAVQVKDLPPPPPPNLRAYFKALGPGVIMASLAIGSGEWITFPAVIATFGPQLLWTAALSCLLQAVLAVESMKYPVFCGQPIHRAYQKLPPSPLGWAWIWTLLLFIPVMWPSWAIASATAALALQLGRLPGPQDSMMLLAWSILALTIGLLVLHIGWKIQRTLELLSWPLIILLFVTVLTAVIIAAHPDDWIAVISGLGGFLNERGGLPPPNKIDWIAISGAIAYIPAGFGFNLMLSSYARDKGWGMAHRVGYISAVIGGRRVELSAEEIPFEINGDNLKKWRGWLNVLRIDSWIVFSLLTFFTVLMTSVMAYSLLTPEQAAALRGFGIAAAQAQALSNILGGVAWIIVLLGGFWILFDTQWGLMDATTRTIMDNFWFASEKIKKWAKGDPRRLYYLILYVLFSISLVIMIGALTLGWASPYQLTLTGANLGLFALTIAYPLQIIVNYKYLPKELRPSIITTIILAAGTVFYGFFLVGVLAQTLFNIKL
ncbi:MAG: Nramp family divalent metal transporter [Aigarchaeota archaeon]|nr:Nramp family divalent metal transporter [Aigarchaeota archaeon]MDW7986318.1 Nramp family divalent metal transporter [Nitrososphaerota archaeon]